MLIHHSRGKKLEAKHVNSTNNHEMSEEMSAANTSLIGQDNEVSLSGNPAFWSVLMVPPNWPIPMWSVADIRANHKPDIADRCILRTDHSRIGFAIGQLQLIFCNFEEAYQVAWYIYFFSWCFTRNDHYSCGQQAAGWPIGAQGWRIDAFEPLTSDQWPSRVALRRATTSSREVRAVASQLLKQYLAIVDPSWR